MTPAITNTANTMITHDHHEYKEKQVYDILIAGGGLTGAAAYCALATVVREQKLTMALCERHSVHANAAAQDQRVLALGRGAVSILQEWGLWEQIRAYAHPVSSMAFFLADRTTVIDARQLGWDAWGWTIPHSRMMQVLMERVAALAKEDNRLDLCAPFCIEDFQLTANGMRLTDKKRHSALAARLVLSAEGAKGVLSAGMQVKRTFLREEYPSDAAAKTAVSAGVSAKGVSPNSGYWFWNTDGGGGVLALIPYKNAENEVARTSVFLPPWQKKEQEQEQEKEKEKVQTKPDDYLKHLTRFSRGMIDDLTSEPGTFLIESYKTEERLKGPLLLLGDAAHRMTPLGGQGYNLTLWTLEKLRQAFEQRPVTGEKEFPANRSFLLDYIIQTQPTIDRRYDLVRLAADGLADRRAAVEKLTRLFSGLPSVAAVCLDFAVGLDADL